MSQSTEGLKEYTVENISAPDVVEDHLKKAASTPEQDTAVEVVVVQFSDETGEVFEEAEFSISEWSEIEEEADNSGNAVEVIAFQRHLDKMQKRAVYESLFGEDSTSDVTDDAEEVIGHVNSKVVDEEIIDAEIVEE